MGGPSATAPLEERFTTARGRVHLTGLQALVRLPLDQVRRDRAAGRRVGALVSGYPGSPLAGLDQAFASVAPLCREHGVRFVPGLNEELAASTVAGTQLLELFPHGHWDGVLGIWYGKAPGLDRALDALRHANLAGTGRFGGALAVVGDDPACKSSSIPSSSEHAFAHAFVPLLSPADAAEVLELGLAGVALSRYASLFVGLRVVADVADGGAIFELPAPREYALPKFEVRGHAFQRRLDPRLLTPYANALEEELCYERLEAARRFALANDLDTVESHGRRDRIGLCASGRLWRELVTALERLGLDTRARQALGIRLYRVRMVWPLEPRRAREFADGLHEIVVVDERRGFLESELRSVVYDAQERPAVLGARDEQGEPWLARHREVTADTLAVDLGLHLASRLSRPELSERAERIRAFESGPLEASARRREPHFCSGCPHSTSTRLPEGSLAGGGIGCHTMALRMDRGVQYVGAMGSEGAHWIGLSGYVDTRHLFQNLGDGTYFHSGRLAVRACVEAGVNVTFKLLYNGAIAMTGGQRAVGEKPLAELVRDLLADGVRRVVAVTDDPAVRALAQFEPNVSCATRAELDALMRRLREERGVTALVYDQLCANEKQRQERRGLRPRPGQRIAIHQDVCEGCGDCAAKSVCASLWPVSTALGRKTRVHEGSCSDDRACLAGDCPAFVSVRTGPRRRPPAGAWPADELPAPPPTVWRGERYEIALVGIGSTGVVTVDALLVRAAELEGLHALHLDQTGLAQRGGKVVSHCVLSRAPIAGSPRAGAGSADVVLAFDPLGAADEQGLRLLDPSHTRAVVHDALHPTGEALARGEHAWVDPAGLVARIRARAAETRTLASEALAEVALGEPLLANALQLGYALQLGLLPVGAAALEQAVRDRGVAVEANLGALRLGRTLAVDVPLAERILADARPPSIGDRGDPERARALLRVAWDRVDEALARFEPPSDCEALRRRVAAFACDLVDYQNRRYAKRYLRALEALARAEAAVTPASAAVTAAAARELYRLMAYKDEYEVARLLLAGPWRRWLARHYEPPIEVTYHLHPPLLRALGLERKLALGRTVEPLLAALVRARRLRATPLDPVGWTRVRRTERALVRWYEGVLEELAQRLRPDRAAAALAIARAPEMLRGFEEVKLAAVSTLQRSIADKLSALGE
jgi:indolepyruvate ferredoxin oxidoreductase